MNNISYNKAQSTLQIQAKYTETLTTFETQAGDLQKNWVPAISHLRSHKELWDFHHWSQSNYWAPILTPVDTNAFHHKKQPAH